MYWYEEDILELEHRKDKYSYAPRTAFYGSSSIRLWTTLEQDFAGYDPCNLGFGGSTLEACVYYFDRAFMGLQPQTLLIYAGDNDLGDGKSPEEVIKSLKRLTDLTQRTFPNSFFGFMSIKPSLTRSDILPTIKRTNEMAREYLQTLGESFAFLNVYEHMIDAHGKPETTLFDTDGLHLSTAGYNLWKALLHRHIDDQTIKMPERRAVC